MTNCLWVRAYGRALDQLRGEASRIAHDRNVDWWAEAGDRGIRFCFEDSESKKAFASICKNLNIEYAEP